MPTILRIKDFRFFFYSLDRGEPPHVHVEHDGKTAKYWLDPVELASSGRFRDYELGTLRKLVIDHATEIRRRWHEHFGNSGSD